MLRLMDVEVENARRHGFSLSCLMIEVDGLTSDSDVGTRATVLPAIFQGLKVVSSHMKMRGLGLTKDPYLLALFPHVEPDQACQLATELIEGAHDLKLSDQPDRRLTLSIGVSHNMHPGDNGLLGLIQEAEVGLGLARDGGGDRLFQWKDVESEVDRMREEIERELDELIQKTKGTDPKVEQKQREGDLLGKVIGLFKDEPQLSESMLRLEQRVIELLRSELEPWAADAVNRESQHVRKIDMLERRLTKLTKSLETTEGELKRVASMKAVDTGLSSIYRNVQGLSDEDDGA
ncbi:MAG: GGDEF domain-containing protein, partial [Planctomycetota bacterium]